jgi:pimeloyl-ACP methyl ester carboxylesterase
VIIESSLGPIYFETMGSGEDPMLLIHGANCDGEFMVPLARELSEFTCVFPDRLGYRRSAALDHDTTTEEQAQAIDAVLKACTSEPAWMFGHSSGGNFALAYALLHPESVRGLILMEPALYATHLPDEAPPEIQSMRDRVLPIFQAGDVEGGLQAFIDVLGGVADETFARLEQLGFAERLAENAVFFAHDQPVVIDWCPTDEQLGSLDLPVLLLEGSESPELLRGIVRILAPKLGAETELLVGCDHMAPQVAAHRVASAISSFIGRNC